jgi:hypothetical protein
MDSLIFILSHQNISQTVSVNLACATTHSAVHPCIATIRFVMCDNPFQPYMIARFVLVNRIVFYAMSREVGPLHLDVTLEGDVLKYC